MSRQVRDPLTDLPDEWTEVDAGDDDDAVSAYLSLKEYDPRDYDTGRPFVMLVRDNARDTDPRKVKVSVVPMHFKVRP